MPTRSFKQYLIIAAKGLAMGAADVVPGVSGGTIAFISGIYEELIKTIDKLDFGILKKYKKEGFLSVWKTYNLSFLMSLLLGIAISVLSFARLISSLLKDQPILVWSFFFGLVLVSIFHIGKQIKKWSISTFAAMSIAVGLSYLITLAEPIGSPEDTWFLFFAGFIAIIAMILPGISGAFILLLLGAYQSVLEIITQFGDGITRLNWKLFSNAFIKLFVFGIGALLGIKVFSKILNWMFGNYKDLILSILTGFMIGALNKIWPWKEVIEYRINHHGERIPFIEKSILPNNFTGDPQVLFSIVLMVIGFLTILLFERFANQKNE
ncbi:MAG: putative membrane protein [Flavobacteriaceae bacterium]|jgi:putative membrane protein